MPIYCPTLTTIDLNATKRHIDKVNQPGSFTADMLAAACEQAQLLSVPKGVWQLYAYDQDEHTILANKPLTLTADNLIRQLTGAVEIAIMAATIGLPLELEVSNLFMQNQAPLGMLLDAAGTTAITATSNAVYNVISQQAAHAGLTAGNRICPGFGGCPLDLQPEILKLSTGSSIDLSLTDTKMLVPRKSVTAIIGLYPYQHTLSFPHQQELTYDKNGQPGCHARKEK
jgi:hypothetical protein